MSSSPLPLTPPDCDLRDFSFMPVDIVRLFGSRFHAVANDAEWRAGVTLWLKSFHQVPAGSLPSDETELCRLAELGRDLKAWRKVKTVALHGWVLCADGRLYHPVVCEKAGEAFEKRKSFRERGKKGNAKRWKQLDLAPQLADGQVPENIREAVSEPPDEGIPEPSLSDSSASPKAVAGQSQGTGTGTGTGTGREVNTESTERSSRLRDSARDLDEPEQGSLPAAIGGAGADAPPRHVAIAVRLRSLGLLRIHAGQAELLGWARDDVTDAELDAALQAALDQGKHPAQIVAKYLDTTLRNLRDRKPKTPAFAHNDFESQDYAGSALRVGARRLADGTYEL
jgi:hypothetical protein